LLFGSRPRYAEVAKDLLTGSDIGRSPLDGLGRLCRGGGRRLLRSAGARGSVVFWGVIVVGAMRVLVVEDDVKMAALLRRGLGHDGFVVDVAGSGEDALWMAASTPYDAVVLDVMLPGIDGFEVCRRLRAEEVWTPVLLLTARDAVRDRVAGLDGGADDYLVKPFSFAELSARLRALVRRGRPERPPMLSVGDLRLDPAAHRAWRGDREIALSAKEFALLETLMRRPGEVLSRLELLERAWDLGYENRSNVIDVYVRYLREKVDRPFGVESIETVRGAGYRLREDAGSR
jgi:two-component system OmpR family response regulator